MIRYTDPITVFHADFYGSSRLPETSLSIYQSTWRQKLEGRENLKSRFEFTRT